MNLHVINKTTIVLPENPNYWPSLSAKVKDYILGGVYEPVLGYFAIDLQDAYEKSINFSKLYAKNNKLTNNKKRITNRSAKLEGIHDKVLINLRNFIVKSINYSWKVNTPKVSLIKKAGNKYEALEKSLIVFFPFYEHENQKDGKGEGKIIEKYAERMK